MKKAAIIFSILVGLALSVGLIGFAVHTVLNLLPNNPFANLFPDRDTPYTWQTMPTPPPSSFPAPGAEAPPQQAVPQEPGNQEAEPPAPPVIELPPPILVTTLDSLGNASHDGLELPVIGATGWAAAYIPLQSVPQRGAVIRETPADDNNENENAENENNFVIMDLIPGQGFQILSTYRSWWYVQLSGDITGWVNNEACFINLPDVIPSIVYDITNAYASLKRSGLYEIPGITGIRLYLAHAFNRRFNDSMFIVPALYATARRLHEVQQAALAAGDTIIMYEAFRPYHTQQSVVTATNALMRNNDYVRQALNTPPWSPTWFISHGISHHQRGAAVDVSLARVTSYEIRFSGGFAYRYVTGHVEYQMPTQMHDLHPAAATFTGPGTGVLSDSMTEGSLILQQLFVEAGFAPLASEWWHFNDNPGVNIARNHNINGRFFTESVYSTIPTADGD